MPQNENPSLPPSDYDPGNASAHTEHIYDEKQVQQVLKSSQKDKTGKKKPFNWRKWVTFLFIGLGVLSVVGTGIVLWVWWLIHDLPDEEAIRRYRPHLSTEIRDMNNTLLLSLGRHRDRLWCSLNTISPWLIKAVITAEDDTFMRHSGIRMEQIRKAFKKNLKRGRYAMGGSTITQQLARNAFLTRKKTITRKIREVFLARRMERTLSKRRILELYLNVVEWGEDIYGSHTAALFYFGKSVQQLNLAEAALLAGMLPNPKYFNPFTRLKKVEKKQRRVLRLMRSNGIISNEELETALAAPIVLREGNDQSYFGKRRKGGSCFNTTLIEYLEKHIGRDKLYRGGTITVTLNRDVQKRLEGLYGTGTHDMLLVAVDEESIRAFTCIGSTAWEHEEIPPQPSETEKIPEETLQENGDVVLKENDIEENGETGNDSLSLTTDERSSSEDESLSHEPSLQHFPYELEKMSLKKFMNESLILK